MSQTNPACPDDVGEVESFQSPRLGVAAKKAINFDDETIGAQTQRGMELYQPFRTGILDKLNCDVTF